MTTKIIPYHQLTSTRDVCDPTGRPSVYMSYDDPFHIVNSGAETEALGAHPTVDITQRPSVYLGPERPYARLGEAEEKPFPGPLLSVAILSAPFVAAGGTFVALKGWKKGRFLKGALFAVGAFVGINLAMGAVGSGLAATAAMRQGGAR